jgi:outer membrane beta-barrel protein
MPMLLNKHRIALLVALATLSLPLAAQAQRKSPLADAPAIRKRFELRQTRFEIGAGAGTTLNQDFYHTVLINARLAFHITDWLSLAGFGLFGVAQVATGFEGRVTGALDPAMKQTTIASEPLRGDAQAGLQQITNILGAQAEFTPFTGKFSLFGKLFASYDFYLYGGFAGITVKTAGTTISDGMGGTQALRSCDDPAPDPTNPTSTNPGHWVCATKGLRPGPTFGVGFHSFFGQSVGLAVELRDVMAQLNPSGRDVNGDKVADASDLSWTHTYVVTGNLVVYLPFQAKVSP